MSEPEGALYCYCRHCLAEDKPRKLCVLLFDGTYFVVCQEHTDRGPILSADAEHVTTY